ncbi:MAG: hypothetical protein RIQ47_1690 [Bacteroidota bacterium]|jgi:hypothetical protein
MLKKFTATFYFKTVVIFNMVFSPVSGQNTIGLISNTAGNEDGYVLFSPNGSDTTYLIDKCGYKVHQWSSNRQPGQSVYLLEDGTLLRTGRSNNNQFNAGGQGGFIDRYDWNSQLLWSYQISNTTECQHHDIRYLPNGNILAIVWELKTPAEALAAGRDSSKIGSALWSEKIIELQPSGTSSAMIVWEWHVWDHLVQEFDNNKPNYGIVSQHPELINLNFISGAPTNADWLHFNALDYNEALDQIVISNHNFSEIWIIDHSTTTTEAASHSGGVYGKGGDLLYRWGNPQAYNRGTATTKKFYGQHNPRWIPTGFADAGNLLVFNNGLGRPGSFSSVEIIQPPIDSAGNYTINGSLAYGPDSAYWKYTDPVPSNFYSLNISGAQRLSSGNTIICSGNRGIFFEIDSLKNIVWKYINPTTTGGAVLSQGAASVQNSVFRAELYPLNYPGLTGHLLTPGNPVELNPTPSNCDMLTGILNGGLQQDERIQPVNPITGSVIVNCTISLSAATITLNDLSGRCVFRKENVFLDYGNNFIETESSLPQGIYLLQVNSGSLHWNFKVVVSE